MQVWVIRLFLKKCCNFLGISLSTFLHGILQLCFDAVTHSLLFNNSLLCTSSIVDLRNVFCIDKDFIFLHTTKSGMRWFTRLNPMAILSIIDLLFLVTCFYYIVHKVKKVKNPFFLSLFFFSFCLISGWTKYHFQLCFLEFLSLQTFTLFLT